MKAGLARMGTVAFGLLAALAFGASAADDAYSRVILADGPVGYWRLDEPYGVVLDHADAAGSPQQGAQQGVHRQYSSEAQDGNYTAGPRPPTYPGFPATNLCYSFLTDFNHLPDNTCHYIEVPDQAALDITGDLTLEAWIKPETTPTDMIPGIMAKWDYYAPRANQRSYSLNFNGAGNKLMFLVSSAGTGASAIFTSQGALTTGQWYHVVAVFKAGVSMKIYTNGNEAVGSVSGTVPASIYNSSAPFYIGTQEYQSDASQFKGCIDEVAVYNKALSAAEALAHYTAPSYPAAVLADGPVGYWRLEEGKVNMEAGLTVTALARNRTAAGDALDGYYANFDAGNHTNAGPRPQAFLGFDAANMASRIVGSEAYTKIRNYVSIADNAALDITSNLTIEAWFNLDQLAAARGIVAKGQMYLLNDAPTNNWSYSLTFNSNSNLQFMVSVDGSLNVGSYGLFKTSASDFSVGVWYHVAAVYDAAARSMVIYTNGVAAAGTTDGTTIPAAIHNSTAPLWFGQYYYFYDLVKLYGRVDEVAIYNQALSATVIRRHYQAGLTGARSGMLILLR